MKEVLTAAVLGILAQGVWAQSFDGSRGAALPSFRFKKATLTYHISDEAKLAQSAKSAVVTSS